MRTYLLSGMFAGSLVGIAIHGIPGYVPAIPLTPLAGLVVGLVMHSVASRRQ